MAPSDVVLRVGFGAGPIAVPHEQTLPPGNQLADPQSLFAALDGRELIVLGNRWRVQVFSVCEMGGCRYVQLSLESAQQYMLTLRVAATADIRQLIPRLLTWLAHPSSSGEILDVG